MPRWSPARRVLPTERLRLQLFPLTRVKTFRFRRDMRRASPHVDCPRG